MTDKEIFDAIRVRRGRPLAQADVDAINAILGPVAAPIPSMDEPAWISNARSKIGRAEIVGPKHNNWIAAGWARLGVKWFNDDETPWCAAFVCAALEAAGIRSPRTPRARGFASGATVAPCDARLGAIGLVVGLVFAIALTEPRGGSDAANLRLRIERVGDEYVINGEKTSISAADQADACVVFGRTGPVDSAAHGVTALLVPTDVPGLTRNRFDCHGQRAIGRGSLFFENVRVPVSHRLGDENKGFVQVMQGFDFSRALIGLQVLAVARVALEEAWAYVAQREAFGKPLSAFQGVSHPLADFDTQVEAARLLCLQALWLKDRGLPHSAQAAMCKWWAPKLAYDAVHQCLLSFGHGGYDRGPMEQRLRDVLGFQIGDGTAQIMKTIVARARAGRRAVGV